MPERAQRLAVTALGGIAIIVVIGIILLAALSENVPDALVAIGSAAAGALAGIVTNVATPRLRTPPAQYEIRASSPPPQYAPPTVTYPQQTEPPTEELPYLRPQQ